MKNILLCFMAFAFTIVPAMSADKDGSYLLVGIGAKTCGAYIEARNASKDSFSSIDSIYFLTWLTGYLSAYNKFASSTYDITGGKDNEGLMIWLDNYCHAHPLDKFSTGVSALTKELYQTRRKTSP
jgi:hypothetical protein